MSEWEWSVMFLYVSVIAFLYLHMYVTLFMWVGKWVGENEN